MTDIHSVLKYVSLDATAAELTQIIEAIKYRRNDIARRQKYTMKIGQSVKFTSKGVTYMGVLKAIKTKYATVETTVPNAVAYTAKMERVPATINYRVPLSLLIAA